MLLSIVSAMLATALLSAGPVWAQDPGGGGADPGGAEPAGEEPMDAEPMDEEPADESADDDSGAEAASGERQSKNSIYAEGLGHGFWYSINYDRIIVDQIAARVGFGYVSFSAAAGSTEASAGILYVPITASWVGLYSGSHGLETGAGATIIYATAAVSSAGTNAEGSGVGAVGTAHVGYRLHAVAGAQPVDGEERLALGELGQLLRRRRLGGSF